MILVDTISLLSDVVYVNSGTHPYEFMIIFPLFLYANFYSAGPEIRRHLWRREFITVLTVICSRNPARMREILFIF